MKLALLLLTALLPSTFGHASSTWLRSDMLLAREGQSAAVVDSRHLLITGGTVPGELFGAVSDSAELLDAKTNVWRFVPPMAVPREGQVAVSLAGGRVLVAGGQDDSFQPQDSVQIFDVGTGNWKTVASLPAPAAEQSGVRLPAGQILVTGGVIGGVASRVSWLFEPRRDRWVRLADMRYPRAGHTSVLLSGDRVLVVSGSSAWAEIYNVRTNRWATAGKPGARLSAAVVALRRDRVLVAGGSSLTGGCLRSARLFTGIAWQRVPPMSERRCSPLATSVKNRTVLVGGGYSAETSRTVQRFDPGTMRWSGFPSFQIVRAGGTLNVVGGELVAAGGNAEGSPVSISESFPLSALAY